MENYTDTENINPQIATYLVALRAEISMLNIISEKKQEALKTVNLLEVQLESVDPDKVAVTSLISSLPGAAAVLSIGSSLLTCL